MDGGMNQNPSKHVGYQTTTSTQIVANDNSDATTIVGNCQKFVVFCVLPALYFHWVFCSRYDCFVFRHGTTGGILPRITLSQMGRQSVRNIPFTQKRQMQPEFTAFSEILPFDLRDLLIRCQFVQDPVDGDSTLCSFRLVVSSCCKIQLKMRNP